MTRAIEDRRGTSIEDHPYRFFGTFRVVLALCVLTSHSSGFLTSFVADLSLGNVGVMLFFVVSGAVIFEALDVFYRTSSSHFLINRALKIFPAYWAALVVYYAMLWASGSLEEHGDLWPIAVNFLLLPSYLPSGNNLLVIEIVWAVIVEFQFYVFAAAVHALARRSPFPGLVLYAAGVGALAVYVFIWETHGYQRFYGAFGFAPYFVLGGAIYYSYARRDKRAMILAALSALLSLHAYIVYISRPTIFTFDWAALAPWPSGRALSTSLFVVGVGMFVWLVSRRFNASAERIDKRFGDITYAIYLIHPAIIAFVVLLGMPDGIGGLASYVTVLVWSILLAILIHQYVERPVMGLRNIFRGRRLYD